MRRESEVRADLLQGLVVEETRRIFGEVELSSLNLFAEFPDGTRVSDERSDNHASSLFGLFARWTLQTENRKQTG